MGRKKVNPNRRPVRENAYDLDQIRAKAAHGAVLQVWAAFLAALSSLKGMTGHKMLSLWTRVTKAPAQIRTLDDTKQELALIRSKTGVDLQVRPLSDAIRTQADLTRFVRIVTANATATVFTFIISPVVQQEMLPPEDLRLVIRRAVTNSEEIAAGQLSVQDIQEMLQDEYHLQLNATEKGCLLSSAQEP